jgi:hypothetical protein
MKKECTVSELILNQSRPEGEKKAMDKPNTGKLTVLTNMEKSEL